MCVRNGPLKFLYGYRHRVGVSRFILVRSHSGLVTLKDF